MLYVIKEQFTLILLSDEARFHVHGYVIFHNNIFSIIIREMPLHYVMVGVWCATSVSRIIRTNFFKQ